MVRAPPGAEVLVTSHQAYCTRTAVGQIIDTTVQNIDDFAAGLRNGNVLVPKGRAGGQGAGGPAGVRPA
ncbi:hypothetical protein VR45_29450 [Streptomyces sp. NRRL S-495]|nr:hypothetical protein VR45_29450 [Streptomyces sp. NRRL S-495]